MLYYPSVSDFYWFTARNVHLLNSNEDKIQSKAVKNVQKILTEAMRTVGT